MSEGGPFSPKLLGAWIAAGVITFTLALWPMFQQDTTTTVGPSTFSISAIGHAGIARVLERMRVPVVRSQGESLHRVSKGGLLVLAEPEMAIPSDGKLESLLKAKTVLLVLPKWEGQGWDAHAGWLRLATRMGTAQWALDQAMAKGQVTTTDDPVTWTRNDLGATPHWADELQLVKPQKPLKPLVATEKGVLLGEIDEAGRKIFILSDPDLIANHGLKLGNAPFAVALFERLRGDGPVVFDETIHGFQPVPRDPWALLGAKRFATTSILALASIVLLLWATVARFGAPANVPPPIKAGKAALVRNVAQLMDYAGYQPILARRYVEATVRHVAARLHAPKGAAAGATLDWLREVGRTRGSRLDAGEIGLRASVIAGSGRRDMAALFGVARDIRLWKQEMLDGPSGGADDRRGDPRRGAQGRGRPG